MSYPTLRENSVEKRNNRSRQNNFFYSYIKNYFYWTLKKVSLIKYDIMYELINFYSYTFMSTEANHLMRPHTGLKILYIVFSTGRLSKNTSHASRVYRRHEDLTLILCLIANWELMSMRCIPSQKID